MFLNFFPWVLLGSYEPEKYKIYSLSTFSFLALLEDMVWIRRIYAADLVTFTEEILNGKLFFLWKGNFILTRCHVTLKPVNGCALIEYSQQYKYIF